ncbi:MAG: GTPase ObgE [Spirochaetia bacterium]|nr:GTPase ObgE [Spirochaetia bacterium]
MSFVDEIEVSVRGGHGGAGSAHFRREKYRPKAGVDGGDGGRGGDVIIEAKTALQSLGHFKNLRLFAAQDGEAGDANNCSGAAGNSLTVYVPPGTEIIDADTDEVLSDLLTVDARLTVARGGKGGLGNSHFVNSVNQAPTYAQPGLPGDERRITLRLKLMADAGLVGLPNAGKSTLIAAISDSKSPIADYPFTTLIPHLGVVENQDYRRILVADIPGIIEGAHKGAGLGLSFLRHIERVRAIVYVLDIQSMDPVEDLRLLQSELESYSPELLNRPYIVLLNKMDTIGYDEAFAKATASEIIERLKSKRPDAAHILAVSARESRNLDQLVKILFEYFPGPTFAESLLMKGQAAATATEELSAQSTPDVSSSEEESRKRPEDP